MSWPKLLILDCDGVLVDSEPLACEADAAAVQIFGTKMLSSAQAMKRFTGKSAAYMRDVLTHEFGVTDIDGCMQKKDDILWELYREKLHTTPGLLAALHKLREAGIALCVASNSGHQRLEHTFAVTDLRAFFGNNIFSAEDVAHGKPAPDLHLYAAARMGFKPTEALVIDDSPSGIEGASAAGIRSLGFIGTNRLGKPWETALMAAGAQDLISSFDALLLKLGLCGKFQSCTNDNTASL